jgi:MATE family multidrug resistance protein
MALGAGLLIVLLRTPLIDLALHIVGGSEAVLVQARRFLEIRWLSAPASLANLVLLGWLLGVQYARAPVILLVVGNLINIVLDLWLVMGLKMNVQGAALATVVAEYATLLIGLWMVWRVLALRGISMAMLKASWRGNIRKLLALNRDIMLRSLLLQLCFGALTVFGARLGPEIVAVNAVLMTLLTFTAYALDGFAYAVEAHSGQAYGARESGQLREVWRAACRQSGLVALAFALIYALTGNHIIALLTSLPELRALASHYLIWQVILPVVGVWCYLLDGMFIGATRGAEMRNSMAIAAAGFGLTLFTLPWLGNHGLWLALAVFLALRGLSLALIWRHHWRNNTWFI